MNIETIQTYLALVKDTVTCLAALVAAIVAVIGLQTWKQQLRGKTEYELAQRLAKATYKLREAIAEFRNPLATFGEIGQALHGIAVGENRKAFVDTVHKTYEQRTRPVGEAFSDFEAVCLEAEAIWGNVVITMANPLRRCLNTLYQNKYAFLEELEKPSDSTDRKELIGQIFTVLYIAPPGSKDNRFSNEIDKAINIVENFLRPYLRI